MSLPIHGTGPAHPLPQHGADPVVRPPWLPVAWFATTVAWLLLGAVGLVSAAPDLALGLVFSPRVVTVTHCFTLGVLTGAIFGALHQFIPAVTGVGPRHPWVGVAGFWAFQAGLVLLLAGFWTWLPGWQAAGWVVLFVGVGGASWNTLPARRHAHRNRQVATYVTLGHSALGLAMALALVRIGDGLGWWVTSREGLVAAHFHLGALGLGTLTAVGVGSKMLPAFLGSRQPDDRPVRWIGWVASAGLLLFSAGAIAPVRPLTLAGGLLMLAAAVGHLGALGSYFATRTNRFDPAAGFLLAATVCYALAIGAGAAVLALPSLRGRGWAAYAILARLGWLVLLIAGVMHRVVPRILTLRVAGMGRRLTRVDQRLEFILTPLAWACLVLLAGAAVLLALTVGLGNPTGARHAATAYAAGAVLATAQALHVVRLVRRSSAEPGQT